MHVKVVFLIKLYTMSSLKNKNLKRNSEGFDRSYLNYNRAKAVQSVYRIYDV